MASRFDNDWRPADGCSLCERVLAFLEGEDVRIISSRAQSKALRQHRNALLSQCRPVSALHERSLVESVEILCDLLAGVHFPTCGVQMGYRSQTGKVPEGYAWNHSGTGIICIEKGLYHGKCRKHRLDR